MQPVLTAEDVLALQHLVRRVPAPKALVRAAVALARMTRPDDASAPDFVQASTSPGAPARGRRSIWCWAPRRGRRSTAGRCPTTRI